MTRDDLVGLILMRIEKRNLRRKDLSQRNVDIILKTFLDTVQEVTLERGERIELRGFGVFSPKQVVGGEKRNPKTGEIFVKKPSRKLHFKATGRSRVGEQERH